MAVAVVTGSNKGIGFAIVRALCKQWTGTVYLTARDVSRGRAAVEQLMTEGLEPRFHQLDITDHSSLDALATHLRDEHGGLDILVNNAAIAYELDSTAPFSEQATVTLSTNYFATLRACEVLFPLLRPGARVCHMSSFLSVSILTQVSKPELRQQILSLLNVDDVTVLMSDFISHASAGDLEKTGWPLNLTLRGTGGLRINSAYPVSKVGITVMTSLQQVAMDTTRPGEDIVVNCCCPGAVATDMTNNIGHKSIDQGAETPLMLALLPTGMHTRGAYVSRGHVQPWRDMVAHVFSKL